MPSKHNYVTVCKFNYSMVACLFLCGIVITLYLAYSYCFIVDISIDIEMDICYNYIYTILKGRHMQDQKSKELRSCRCLNPLPEKVTCDLFKETGFFDPRDLLQVKYEMVRQIEVEKKPIRHAARQFGFSRPSAYKALDTFQTNGVPGLLRTKPGPRRAHKLNDTVIKFIEAQRSTCPSLSLSELVDRIKNELGVVVHRRSIQRVMNRGKKRNVKYHE